MTQLFRRKLIAELTVEGERPVALLGAVACAFIMYGLPAQAWSRFGWWLAIGIAIYLAYGYRHRRLKQSS